MINDFKNLCLVNIGYRLRLLIMIDKNQLLFLRIHQVSSGKHSDIILIFIEDREVTVTNFCYRFTHFIHIIIQIKMHNILFCHKMLNRNTLVDQTRSGKCIIRSGNHYHFLLLCGLDDFRTYFISIGNDHTTAIRCNAKKLVSDHHKIIVVHCRR